jgi:hypothetical protein
VTVKPSAGDATAHVDERGRMLLPAGVQSWMGARPGSAWRFIPLDGAALVVREDEAFERLAAIARTSMADAGITVEDVISKLPAARDETVLAVYGEEMVAKLRAVHRKVADQEYFDNGE